MFDRSFGLLEPVVSGRRPQTKNEFLFYLIPCQLFSILCCPYLLLPSDHAVSKHILPQLGSKVQTVLLLGQAISSHSHVWYNFESRIIWVISCQTSHFYSLLLPLTVALLHRKVMPGRSDHAKVTPLSKACTRMHIDKRTYM